MRQLADDERELGLTLLAAIERSAERGAERGAERAEPAFGRAAESLGRAQALNEARAGRRCRARGSFTPSLTRPPPRLSSGAGRGRARAGDGAVAGLPLPGRSEARARRRRRPRADDGIVAPHARPQARVAEKGENGREWLRVAESG